MNLYLVQGLSTCSNAVVAALDENGVRSLLKYNYNLSDGNITLISNDSIYSCEDIIILNDNNDPLWN